MHLPQIRLMPSRPFVIRCICLMRGALCIHLLKNLHFTPLPINVTLGLIFFFIPKCLVECILSCTTGDITIISNHAIVLMDLFFGGSSVKTRCWSFNACLFRNEKFTSYLKSELKIFLDIDSQSVNNPSLLWETSKAYIRGLVLAFSASKKRKQLEQTRTAKT